MGADQDLLFGKLAQSQKYCSTVQIEAALKIQAQSPDRLPLGQILVREGYLTQEEHSELLSAG